MLTVSTFTLSTLCVTTKAQFRFWSQQFENNALMTSNIVCCVIFINEIIMIIYTFQVNVSNLYELESSSNAIFVLKLTDDADTAR